MDVNVLDDGTLVIRSKDNLDQSPKRFDQGTDASIVDSIGHVHQGKSAFRPATDRFHHARVATIGLGWR
jgi:hypothetical protein